MDMQGRIGGEVFELLSDLGERLLLTEPFAQERFERGEERRGCRLGLLAPDLEREAQVRQIEVQILQVLSALAGEVRGRLSGTAQGGGAVRDDVVFLLALVLLALLALLFFDFTLVAMCHAGRILRLRSASVMAAGGVLSRVSSLVLPVLGL